MTARVAGRGGAAALIVAAWTVFPGAASSQLVVPTLDTLKPIAAAPMEVPFAVGETLEYEVKFGRRTVGDGFLRIPKVQEIRGRPAYHAQMGLNGSMWPFSISYLFETWMDVTTLASYRYIQDQTGVDARYRAYNIYPQERRWTRIDWEDEGETLSDVPLDQVSFFYFLRTIPLEVGQEYVLDQYFKEDGNPVVIRVLRKDRKTVPAGTFDTIVIEPIIQTSGLFGDGGQAEIHLTDDENRHMVYMLSRVKILPDIHLLLKSVR